MVFYYLQKRTFSIHHIDATVQAKVNYFHEDVFSSWYWCVGEVFQ